jgi:hypothetical protein
VHAVLDVLEALMLEEEKVAAVEELDEDSWAEVIEVLPVELDERIEGLLLEDGTMVCRVDTEDEEMEEEEELFKAILFVV